MHLETPASVAADAVPGVGKGKIVVLHSKAITALFTLIRDKNTPPKLFAEYADRLMRYAVGVSTGWPVSCDVVLDRSVSCVSCCSMLAEEGLANLPTVTPVTVETPCGPYAGLAYPSVESLAVVSIVRAGV